MSEQPINYSEYESNPEEQMVNDQVCDGESCLKYLDTYLSEVGVNSPGEKSVDLTV